MNCTQTTVHADHKTTMLLLVRAASSSQDICFHTLHSTPYNVCSCRLVKSKPQVVYLT